jgi:hypothetical protein
MATARARSRQNERVREIEGSKGFERCKEEGGRGSVGVGDIPNRYTSDVVLNQQARVAHQGGMADCLPGGPVAGKTMAVLDAGAHGGSADRPMGGCLVLHA